MAMRSIRVPHALGRHEPGDLVALPDLLRSEAAEVVRAWAAQPSLRGRGRLTITSVENFFGGHSPLVDGGLGVPHDRHQELNAFGPVLLSDSPDFPSRRA
jgi:hypothetical protein